MELDAIPADTLEQIERIGSADVVVGVLRRDPEGEANGAARLVREALGSLPATGRTVLIHNNGAAAGTPRDAPAENGVYVLSCGLSGGDLAGEPEQGVADAYRVIFAAGGKLAARACGVIASDLRAVTPQWILELVQPVLEKAFDLVTPCYAGHKYDGLLNKSMVAPLHRALYGVRIESPMGPDFGVSDKLLGQLLARNPQTGRAGAPPLAASISAAAASAGLQICEANPSSSRYRRFQRF